MTALQLQQSLPKIEGALNFDTLIFEMTDTPSFICDDMLCISTEHEAHTGDYYGEFRGGYPHINEKLEVWAKEHNGYFEWYDPSYFIFNPN